MTVADRTEGHQARCLPHLLTLRMLASDNAEAPSPWLVMAEVAQATDARATHTNRDRPNFMGTSVGELTGGSEGKI